METEHTRDWTAELSEELMPPGSTGSDDDVDIPEEVEDWVDETKGVERIVSVAITTSKPRTADWIADQAVVSEQTARDHLQTFAELGVVTSFTSSGVTRYFADEAFIHYREVSRCVEQHSKDEISDQIEEIQTAIEETRDEYEVDVPDQLRAKAAESETSVREVREYKKRAAEWETLQDRLEVFEDALRRFEKFDQPTTVRA